ACRPSGFRLEGAAPACRNSTYELIWISMRFGGVMTSLILPKLMRSATRDGIVDLRLWAGTRPDRDFLLRTKPNRRSGGLLRNSRQIFQDLHFETVRVCFVACYSRPGDDEAAEQSVAPHL